MSSDLKIGVLLNFFLVFFFFYHFFGLHWMKLIRNGMLKIMGFFLETRGKKRRKNTVHMEEKKFEKRKGPDGIRTRDLRLPWQPSRCLTRPTPYHLATEPLTHTGGKIKRLKPSTQNAH